MCETTIPQHPNFCVECRKRHEPWPENAVHWKCIDCEEVYWHTNEKDTKLPRTARNWRLLRGGESEKIRHALCSSHSGYEQIRALHRVEKKLEDVAQVLGLFDFTKQVRDDVVWKIDDCRKILSDVL